MGNKNNQSSKVNNTNNNQADDIRESFSNDKEKTFSQFYMKLKKYKGGDYINFNTFTYIITSKFPFVPLILVECLYRGFGKNVNKMLLKTQFVTVLAGLSVDNDDRTIIKDFLFRAYDVRQCGSIEYEYIHDILILAYSDEGKKNIEINLNNIFAKAGAKCVNISMKRFKRFTGDLSILTDWVQIILSSLTESNRYLNLAILNYHKYNLNIYARRAKVPYYIMMSMNKRFKKICGGENGSTLKTMYDFLFNETTRNIVMLSPMLFIILFLTKKTKNSTVWHKFDFFEFCIVFSNFYNNNDIIINCLVEMFHDHIFASVINNNYYKDADNKEVKINIMKILLITSFPNQNVIEAELDFIQANLNLRDMRSDDLVEAIYLYYTSSYDYNKLPHEIYERVKQLELSTTSCESSHLDFDDKSFYCDLLKSCIGIEDKVIFDAFSELILVTCVFFGIRPRFVAIEKTLIQTIIERQHEHFRDTWMCLGPIGTVWSIIDKEWFVQWQNNSFDIWSIPITNARLIHREKELLPTLINGNHYDVIPVLAFLGLHAWYLGGPVIARKVIFNSSNVLEIEMYPIVLYISLYGEEKLFTMFTVSKFSTIRQLLVDLCRLTDADISCVRLWEKNTNQRILSLDISIDEAGLNHNQHLLFETPISNGNWLSSEKKDSENKMNQESDKQSQKNNDLIFLNNSTGSQVGLANLGKTCYINASLQALFHTRPFRDYFLSLEYIKDLKQIVSDYTADSGRQLTSEIGNLIILIWTKSNIKTIIPYAIINQLYRINSEFSLERQEDVHEFFSLLLNILSQDLNNTSFYRDRQFKMTMSDETDEIFSLKSELFNLSNESSFIQYLFTGQFKSTICCPNKINCSYESKQFEHFNTLQLPLSFTNYRLLRIFIMGLNSSNVYELYIHIDENFTISMVKEQLIIENPSVLQYVRKESVFIAADICKSKVNALLRNGTKVSQIAFDLMLFEVSDFQYDKIRKLPHIKCPVDENLENKKYIRILFNQRRITMINDSIFDILNIEAVGFPFVEIIESNITTSAILYKIVSKRVAPYIVNGTSINETCILNDNKNNNKNSISDDDVIFGGGVNEYGFTLRITKGGVSGDFSSCSKCSWLSRCHGCSILNHLDTTNPILVKDGYTISIDWNYLLFENSYDIHKASATLSLNNIKSIKYNPSESIEDCLDKFIETEDINGSNCSHCFKNSLQKSLAIYKFPPILLVQLQRFYFNGFKHEKNNKLIVFPLTNFDVSKYLPQNNINGEKDSHVYDLYCIVNHVGSLSSGHYYTYSKNMESNEWYDFNDDVVSKLKEENVVTLAAYLLFYIRHDIMKKSHAQIVDQRLKDMSKILHYTEISNHGGQSEQEKQPKPDKDKGRSEQEKQPTSDRDTNFDHLQHTKASKIEFSKKYGRPYQEDCMIV